MDDLVSEFTAESREMLAALDGEVVAWEAAPDDRARLDAIFRCVHTIKGNSGFFDLPRLAALSHAAEDALAQVRAGRRHADRPLVSAVLAALDRIGELVEALEQGREAGGDDLLLIAALAGDGAVPEAAAARIVSPARSVRLSVDLLDRMMNGVSDLVLARNALARDLRERDGAAEPFGRLTAAVAVLREAITRTRMQRLEAVFAPLPRLVRDLCGESGREARLDLEGGDVELDREMIELVRDPLVHMLRNAIAHGIEPPERREALGKPRAGILRLAARQSGNSILVELSDDGAGVDAAALAERAVSLGLVAPAEIAALAPERRLELLFLPGLSTAGSVSAMSGRGVGLDVVRSNVERIGGAVSVESARGRGTRFTLRVPLTLAIIPGLMVEAAGRHFALPRAAVEEIVRSTGAGVRIHRLGGGAVLELRGRHLPVMPLAQVLGLPAGAEPPFIVLLRAAGGAVFGLGVDRVEDHEELVVKPAAPAVMETGLYGGTTLTEDGNPVLMLDPAGLAARCGIVASAEPAPRLEAPLPAAEPLRPALLFTSLCGARRAVPLDAVLRIEEVESFAVTLAAGRFHVALGDRLVPLHGCLSLPQAQRLHIIRLSDGEREGAYAAAAVLDTVAIPADTTPVGGDGEIAAVALIGEQPVELLDLHRLFAAGIAAAGASRLLCLLPRDDPWVDNFLRPLVESAGYATAFGAEGAEIPGLAIVREDESPPAGLPDTARILRLRSREAPDGAADGSIYRYDRDALLRALARR